jgi:hypothetical protein
MDETKPELHLPAITSQPGEDLETLAALYETMILAAAGPPSHLPGNAPILSAAEAES